MKYFAMLFLLMAARAYAGSIHGQVNASEIDLDLYDATGKLLKEHTAKTNADGAFILENIPHGRYKLKADPPPPPKSFWIDEYFSRDPSKNAYNISEADILEINEATPHIENVKIVLEQGGSMQGKITDAKTGQAIEGIDLDFYDTNHRKLGFSAKTKSDGIFTLKPIPAGLFYIKADAPKSMPYIDQKRLDPIAIVVGQTIQSIDFKMVRGGFLTGVVVFKNQKLVDVDMDLYEASTGRFLSEYNAKTQADGSFMFGPLPEGNYLVKAVPAKDSGLEQQYYKSKKSKKNAIAIHVNVEKTNEHLNFSLRKKKS